MILSCFEIYRDFCEHVVGCHGVHIAQVRNKFTTAMRTVEPPEAWLLTKDTYRYIMSISALYIRPEKPAQ